MPDPRVPLILSAQGLTLKDILSDGTRDRVAREENVTYVIHVSMSVFINMTQVYWAKPDHMHISYTGCPKKTYFQNAVVATMHWLNHK